MLNTYTGTKTVMAEPMTMHEFGLKTGRPIITNPGAPDRAGYYVLYPDGYESWSPKDVFEGAYNLINPNEKMLDISEVKGAKANISDLKVYGDGDTFALLCKASSQAQGWMKSTKVCNVPGGCIVQVTTQQKNPGGSYAVAEALTYVPGVKLDREANPRRLTAI